MLNVLSCVVVDHNFLFTVIAALICVTGSVLTLQLFSRVRRSQDVLKNLWLALAGLMGAATFWSTHFVAMLGYKSSVMIGYDAPLTILSLVIAVATTTAGFYLAASTSSSWRIEAGGAIVGGGVAVMHYVGMFALEMYGHIQWDGAYVAASVILAVLFGMLAVNRVARPVTRFCRSGGVVALVLGVVSLHFTGMTAMNIVPHAIVLTNNHFMSPTVLAACVVLVTSLLGLITAITYFIDMQNARSAGERYRHLALHDPLTGVGNRGGLEDHLEQLLAAHPGSAARIAVVTIDFDRFKEINDVHGHAAGDELLRTFASRASEALVAGEYLARFGGDEFVAVKHPVYTRKESDAFAQKMLDIAGLDVEWNGKSLSSSASVGYALYPDHAKTPAALVECSDLAMYSAKSGGVRGVVAFNQGHATAKRNRSALAMDLVGAVQRGEFELYYQPQNDTISREIIGYEALIRWNHPERGIVSPAEFIPIAEDNNRLIVEIGAWALRTACAEAASWRRPRTIAVNVAAAQLASNDFVPLVAEVLKETGLAPERLELEITESGIIGDLPHALNIIRQLKSLGVSIAMDDFGTGYSSLSTLQNFPFDKIKIDREFVRNLEDNEHSAAIVRATIILGDSLNKKILAEGVETEQQMAFLKDVGCSAVQGYLFGRPEPVGAMLAVETLHERRLAEAEERAVKSAPSAGAA